VLLKLGVEVFATLKTQNTYVLAVTVSEIKLGSEAEIMTNAT
jgi:hypothetical protein